MAAMMWRVSCAKKNSFKIKTTNESRVECYLIECFVIPVGVNFAQLVSNAIVFAHENCVKSDKHHLLVDTRITGDETVDIAARAKASSIRVVKLGRQEIFQAQSRVHGVALELALAESAQFCRGFLVSSVHKVGVDEACHGVESTPGSCGV